jgi:glycosyltransferase involved in cell wall biosynthesis
MKPAGRSTLSRVVRRACGIHLGSLRIHAPRPFVPAPDDDADGPAPTLGFALVTPVLNQARFVEAAIASVAAQRYQGIDYLVKDGLSIDGTVERARRAAAGVGRVVSSADEGLASAVNQGFSQVRGDVLGWLNADDLLLPGALRHVARFLEARPDVDAVYGHRVLVDENGDEVGRWLLPPHDDRVLSYADYVPQESLFWRREAWERIGARLDESFRFAVDWDLLLRLRDSGARFARLPRFLGAFRVHPQQKTEREMQGIGMQEMQRLWQRTLGHVPSKWERARATAGYLARHAALNALHRTGFAA